MTEAVTLPHRLPITSPGAWCFICGDPYNDRPTPAMCGVARQTEDSSDGEDQA